HRDAQAVEIPGIAHALRDVNARHLADVEPVAVELELGPEADAHAERVAVEAARGFDVVADDEIVLELRQGHLLRSSERRRAQSTTLQRPKGSAARYGCAEGRDTDARLSRVVAPAGLSRIVAPERVAAGR